MSVGLPVTKADLDARAGSIAVDVRSAFDRVRLYKLRLDTFTVADLQALGYLATPTDEAAILKSAFTDLDRLRTIFEGTATQATTYDFRTFSKLLTGVI